MATLASKQNRAAPVVSSAHSSHGRVTSTLIAILSLLRVLCLVFAIRPGTPLRAMCLAAFDMLHVLRRGSRLSLSRLQTLSELLNLGANANAVFDGKRASPDSIDDIRAQLPVPQHTAVPGDYLSELESLERRRPSPGGNAINHRAAQLYRESVVRVSLGMLATVSFDLPSLQTGIEATRRDHDLAIIFCIVMLCQIIDDVVDYSGDLASALPSFLTAHASLEEGLTQTTLAATEYHRELPESACLSPFRLAASLLAAFASISLTAGLCRTRLSRLFSVGC